MRAGLSVQGFALNSHRLPSWRVMLGCAVFFMLGGQQVHAGATQYFLPQSPSAVLRFAAIDPEGGPVDEQWLLKELAAALQTRSRWPLSRVGQVTPELSGLRTRLDPDRSLILFEYVHLARNRSGNEWGETLTIPVTYQVQKTNVLFLIHMEAPRQAQFATPRAPGVFFLPSPKLRHITELFDDFAAIMAGTETLELRGTNLLTGEVQSTESPQRCIEKFDYALGRYAYAKGEDRIFDLKNDNVFLFRTASTSVPLKIGTLEYHAMTKVFYQAWLPFGLRADGTVNGSDLPAIVRTAIRQVLEDTPTRAAQGAAR